MYKIFLLTCLVSSIFFQTVKSQNDVLIDENFNDNQLEARGWYDGTACRISDNSMLGAGCIEYEWIKDVQGVQGSSPQRHLFKPSDEIYIRYYLRLSKGWKWTGVNWHPHLTHFLTTENGEFDGPAATHLTLYIEPVNGKLRLAAQDIQNEHTAHGLTQGPLKGGYNGMLYDSKDTLFNDDKWHCIEAYFKLNSLDIKNDVPVKDGIVRGWFDGKMVIEHTDVILRSTDFPGMKFNQFLMAPYFGPGLLNNDQKLWIDELVISNIRVGALASANLQDETNYDESKIPPYKLPELLVSLKGKVITNAKEWMEIRRPEILSLFEENMYGKIPGVLKISSSKTVEKNNSALGGKAIRKQVILTFRNKGKELNVNLLIYLPKNLPKAPVFAGYNFYGNQSVEDDPDIIITDSWVRDDSVHQVFNHHAGEQSRGTEKGRWQVEKIIAAGYGLVTVYYGDVDPDKDDFSDGVHPLLYSDGQTKPLPDEWGSISAWAWGLSRVMDYIEQDPDIDASKVVVMGHSRLGKTALWAGALDQRFAIVISNNSGCGGAALSRRLYGERLGGMDQYFPYWLCKNCNQYDGKEYNLPVDQHMLIALIAPRPVYIASAVDDKWADPKGEYLSGYYATPVYKLFGNKGLDSIEMPEVSHPVMNTIGYHIRPGVHGVFAYDWEQYIRFADLHFNHSHGEK